MFCEASFDDTWRPYWANRPEKHKTPRRANHHEGHKTLRKANRLEEYKTPRRDNRPDGHKISTNHFIWLIDDHFIIGINHEALC